MIVFGLSPIIKLLSAGNCLFGGLRGSGKDMLMGNCIARRKKPYISNIDYGCKSQFIPLDFSSIDVGNDSFNFVSNKVNNYAYPYPEKCDIYVSDIGVYFPSYDFKQLDKSYRYVLPFFALSRHLGDCNFHCNSQSFSRVWDKIREQSDTYIRCLKCRLIGKLVVLDVVVYDKYQSAVDFVKPFKPVPYPLFSNVDSRATITQTNALLKTQYDNSYGSVKSYKLLFFNKCKYDTRYFKKFLSGC